MEAGATGGPSSSPAPPRMPEGAVGRVYSWIVGRRLAKRGRALQVGYPVTIKNPRSVVLGDEVVIRDHVFLNCEQPARPTLVIGSRCYIGRFVQMNAAESVVVEDDVLIADRVYISDYEHAFRDPSRPVMAQGFTDPEPVVIGAGSWLGVGCVIMRGVTIGRGAIVGANAVVTRDVGDLEIVGGIPASVIGSRAGG